MLVSSFSKSVFLFLKMVMCKSMAENDMHNVARGSVMCTLVSQSSPGVPLFFFHLHSLHT